MAGAQAKGLLMALFFGGIAAGLVYWQQEELPTGLRDVDHCVRRAEVKTETSGFRRRSTSYVLYISADRFRFRHNMGGFGADEALVQRVRPGACFTFTVDAGAYDHNDPRHYKQPASVVALGMPPLRVYGLKQREETVLGFWDALGDDLIGLGIMIAICLFLALIGLMGALFGHRAALE